MVWSKKIISNLFKKLHVGFYDPCCPAAGDKTVEVTGVRYNLTDTTLEYYDPVDKDWKSA